MQHRLLGQTGLNISALSLGGAAFGNMYGDLDIGEICRTVHAAIDSGINLVDTSPFYGLTKSESNLGIALRGGYREKIVLCSKAGRNDRASFDFSPSAMRRSVDASLQRLGTDYLDILIAHDIEYADDFEAVFTETASVLHDLKKEGKTRFVGMSCYPLGLLSRAIERCRLDVVISYCHHCLQNTLLIDQLLPIAQQHGVGILNASPLSMGLLTQQGPPAWHPAPEDIRTACRKASEICHLRGSDISFLGMQFCFAEERIASVVSGAAREKELEVNLKALTTPIDRELLAEVQAILKPIRDKTWANGNWKQ